MTRRLLALALPLALVACVETQKADDASDAAPTTDSGGDAGDEASPVRFSVSVRNLSEPAPFSQAHTFSMPDGASSSAPLAPGSAYSLRFPATPGSRLGFATMFVQSNDLFYGPAPEGLALFDADGQPLLGDRTAEVYLWDAGTEANEPLFEGASQAPRQSAGDVGEDDPDNTVRIADVDISPEETIAVSLSHDGEQFTLTIENIAEDRYPGPLLLAPGAAAVHGAEGMLFAAGAPASGGLELLAEDGDPSGLFDEVMAETRLFSPFAPGAFAVHTGENPLFMDGSPASQGLEMLAEDGEPGGLVAELEAQGVVAGAFSMPDGGAEAGPLLPGSAYAFEVEAVPGDRLSLATMLVFSNDLFLAPGSEGIALFDGDTPVHGILSEQLMVWDAGTEANQRPGAGLDQAPWQAGPDTGAMDDNDAVRPVDDGFLYPAAEQLLEIVITPM